MAKDEVAYHGKPKQSIGQRVSGFGRSIWNSDTNEFIGRTGSSWGKLKILIIMKVSSFL